MRLILCGMAVVIFLPPLAKGDDTQDKAKDKADAKAKKEKTPEDELQTLVGEFGKARGELSDRQREAKTDEQRQKVKQDTEKMQQEFAGRFLQFAQKYPKEDSAPQLLAGALAFGTSAQAGKALELLAEHHGEALGDLLERMASQPEFESKLRGMMANAANPKVKTVAMFGLAKALSSRSESPEVRPEQAAKLSKEAEDLYEKIVTDAKVKADMLESAKSDLWVLRNLSIGKKAPDIAGKDSDGKEFKLSDYQGKVVVIDFWANW